MLGLRFGLPHIKCRRLHNELPRSVLVASMITRNITFRMMAVVCPSAWLLSGCATPREVETLPGTSHESTSWEAQAAVAELKDYSDTRFRAAPASEFFKPLAECAFVYSDPLDTIAGVLRLVHDELLHDPCYTYDPEFWKSMGSVARDRFVWDAYGSRDPKFGYSNPDYYVVENSVRALEQIASERLGVARPPGPDRRVGSKRLEHCRGVVPGGRPLARRKATAVAEHAGLLRVEIAPGAQERLPGRNDLRGPLVRRDQSEEPERLHRDLQAGRWHSCFPGRATSPPGPGCSASPDPAPSPPTSHGPGRALLDTRRVCRGRTESVR